MKVAIEQCDSNFRAMNDGTVRAQVVAAPTVTLASEILRPVDRLVARLTRVNPQRTANGRIQFDLGRSRLPVGTTQVTVVSDNVATPCARLSGSRTAVGEYSTSGLGIAEHDCWLWD